MAQNVGERILDPSRSGDVTMAEMDKAMVAVALAQADGEIDSARAQTFFKLIEIGIRRRISSPEGREDVKAWMDIEIAEARLPRGAVSKSIN